MRLAVKVVAGASKSRIAGWLGDALKVTVRAPAERGKANRAVAEVLSAAIGVEPRLVDGHRSPRKVFEIPGLEEAEVRERVRRALLPG